MKNTGLPLFGALAALGLSSIVSAAPVTFSKDVAPIVQKRCQTCHRPGQVAPMSFLNYKEVRPWAKSIKAAVLTKKMPPWFADPAHGEFSNDAHLSQQEIETISAWVEGGALEGNPKDMPANPTFVDGWTIGKPDVVLSMTDEYSIPTEGT